MGLGGHIFSPDTEEGEPLKVSLLQGNISQYMKWDPEYENQILNTYSRLFSVAEKENPDLIVWPETSLPGALTSSRGLMEYMKKLSGKSGAWQIVGSYERRREKFFNNAYILNPEGEIKDFYRKVRLTPFGEFVPLRALFAPLVTVLGQFGDFSPGKEIAPLKAGEAALAPAICYESIFPSIVRRGIKKGGKAFVNITNDGWFLDTAGPPQHFIHSLIRSAENRVWTVRAANTGISAIIDPRGSIVDKSSLMEEKVVSGRIYLREQKTFYTKYGGLFTAAAVVVMLFKTVKEEKCLKNTGKD